VGEAPLAKGRAIAEHADEAGTAANDVGVRPVHDVLVAIPRRHRLSTKLLGVTALLALAALAGIVVAERRMQRDLRRQLEASTALLADAIRTAGEAGLSEASPAHDYGAIARISRLDGIERVRVLAKSGRVAFSTLPEDRGRVVPMADDGCRACHRDRGAPPRARVEPEDRAHVQPGPRGRTLSLVAPIPNDHSCSTAACHVHPPGRQVLGVLEVDVSLEPLEASVAAFRRGFLALLAGAVLALAGVLYVLGRAEVVEPVAALVEGTRRVARDDLDVEIRVPRLHGEMAVLAASFNDMTRSVRELEGELKGLNSGLERDVAARTAALEAAQEQLVRTEKLSSLGKLSASIAHEINNPLAGILTFAKLVSRTLEEGPPDEAHRAAIRRNLALVEREAQRCSAIVRNLLDFARERPTALRPMDVNAAVEEALSLLTNQVAIQGVALERALSPVPSVLADFGQLRQAFVNVAMNACEAMGQGGTLRVSSRDAEGSVEIAFADTGPGIPPERLRKIFDPFFTTKEKGTGLGLSVVYGIIERHGGRIDVASRVGEGTTFTLRLPAAQEHASSGNAA
jgi:two-component system NtrC family sensor kinase